MRKIIGFKLAIRINEVKRRAKKAKLDLAALGLDDPALERIIDLALLQAVPAVLFDTFKHPDRDQQALSPMPGLAYSLVLATLGDKFGAVESEPADSSLWKILKEIALDETIRFAASLLEVEASKDSCELSPINMLAESAALETAVRKLDGAKIGLRCAENGLNPSASIAVSLSWLSKSKAKGKSK